MKKLNIKKMLKNAKPSQFYTFAQMAKRNFDEGELENCVLPTLESYNEFLEMLTAEERKTWEAYLNTLPQATSD